MVQMSIQTGQCARSAECKICGRNGKKQNGSGRGLGWLRSIGEREAEHSIRLEGLGCRWVQQFRVLGLEWNGLLDRVEVECRWLGVWIWLRLSGLEAEGWADAGQRECQQVSSKGMSAEIAKGAESIGTIIHTQYVPHIRILSCTTAPVFRSFFACRKQGSVGCSIFAFTLGPEMALGGFMARAWRCSLKYSLFLGAPGENPSNNSKAQRRLIQRTPPTYANSTKTSTLMEPLLCLL